MAILSGSQSLSSIHRFSERHHLEICGLLGIAKFDQPPSYYAFRNVLLKLECSKLEETFNQFYQNKDCQLLHLDGKASRGTVSNHSGAEQAFLMTVSMYSSELSQTIARESFNSKEDSETAIARKLLRALEQEKEEAKIVTADSAHCNQETVKIFKKHEYLLQFKGNQKKLREEALRIEASRAPESEHDSTEMNRGRLEQRKTKVYRFQSKKWKNAKSIIIQERWRNGKYEKAFYLSSKLRAASRRAFHIRSHWLIETMHNEKDVLMGEDRSPIKNINLAANMSCFRTIALNICKQAQHQSFTAFCDLFSHNIDALYKLL